MCLGALSQTILSHSPPFLVRPPDSKLQMHHSPPPLSLFTFVLFYELVLGALPLPRRVSTVRTVAWSKIARLYYFRGREGRRIFSAKIALTSMRSPLFLLAQAWHRYSNQLDMFGLISNSLPFRHHYTASSPFFVALSTLFLLLSLNMCYKENLNPTFNSLYY